MKRPSKPRGRPKSDEHWEESHLYIRKATMERVRKMAAHEDRSLASVIRVLIERGLHEMEVR